MACPNRPSSPLRRRLLTTAGLALLVPLVPAGCASEPRERTGWLDLARRLTGFDDATALQIGRAHAARLDDAAGIPAGLPTIDGADWRADGLHHAPDIDPATRLEAHVRAQYRDGRVAAVEGWVLSRLELDVLAMAAGQAG